MGTGGKTSHEETIKARTNNQGVLTTGNTRVDWLAHLATKVVSGSRESTELSWSDDTGKLGVDGVDRVGKIEKFVHQCTTERCQAHDHTEAN
ncbi:MAG: hypothetical protein JWN70_1001 [Planctomycetaceae bacterium]|nr:hypothetical protein [Planctomycetaceae bacterium]